MIEKHTGVGAAGELGPPPLRPPNPGKKIYFCRQEARAEEMAPVVWTAGRFVSNNITTVVDMTQASVTLS